MKNNNGIRNIHDAIDTLVNRAILEISGIKNKREKEIEENVYREFGITDMLDKLENLTGIRPHLYRRDGNCELDKTLAEARKELVKYDQIAREITRESENAHIAVVIGDKKDVIDNLEKMIKFIKAKLG